MSSREGVAAIEPHEAGEGCMDCPHEDYCAGMGKCEIGAAKLAAKRPDPPAASGREPTCYGYCGYLGWTVENHGRVTHKQSCPHRAEPWCQAHPEGCPDDCEPVMWKEWNERVNSNA